MFSGKHFLGLPVFALVLLAGCNNDEQSATPSPSVTTSGTTAGSTGGSTSGSTSGTTSGTTTSTSGSTGGTTTGTIPDYGFSIGIADYSGVYVTCAEWAGFYRLTFGVANSPVTGLVYLGGGRPTSGGTYTLVPYTGATQPGKASLLFNMGPATNNVYGSVSGELHVTILNGEVQTSYTNAVLKSLATGQINSSAGTIGCF